MFIPTTQNSFPRFLTDGGRLKLAIGRRPKLIPYSEPSQSLSPPAFCSWDAPISPGKHFTLQITYSFHAPLPVKWVQASTSHWLIEFFLLCDILTHRINLYAWSVNQFISADLISEPSDGRRKLLLPIHVVKRIATPLHTHPHTTFQRISTYMNESLLNKRSLIKLYIS